MISTQINVIKQAHEAKRKARRKHGIKMLICALLIGGITASTVYAVAIATRRNLYVTEAEIYNRSTTGTTFITPDGNLWFCKNEYPDRGNGKFKLLFDDNGTARAMDDIIIGYWQDGEI